MKEALLDANVILRYLTKDPAPMAEAASKIFHDARNGRVSLRIGILTVAEVVWTLESFYGHPKKEIADTLTQFLSCEGLLVDDLNLLIEAFHLYAAHNVDFADAFLAATALRQGPRFVYSFDQHLDRINGITRLEPGQKAL